MVASKLDTTSCNHITTLYTSSQLEQAWLDNAAIWEEDFCSTVAKFNDSVATWLHTVSQLRDSSHVSAVNRDVFSSYTHRFNCGGITRSITTYIEPLSHGLRHPNSLCRRGAGLTNRDYLLMAFGDDLRMLEGYAGGTQACQGRRCQHIYFDLGASTWQEGSGGPSQSWFVNTYRGHGVNFDRILLWEAKVHDPKSIFYTLPRELWHKYQYFNVPASSNVSDPSSPIAILRTIAQPGDFVLFKLDIDNSPIENAIVESILSSSDISGLIDEFVFEHHVNFIPMHKFWGGNLKSTFAESYKLFHSMRKLGIRAHSWV